MVRFAAVLLVALVFAAPAAAACAHPRTSLAYLEGQVMCPTCHTTLDQSDSAAAQRIELFISRKLSERYAAFLSFTLSRSQLGSTLDDSKRVSPFDRTYVFQLGGVVYLTKHSASLPPRPELLGEVRRHADVVITGVGD